MAIGTRLFSDVCDAWRMPDPAPAVEWVPRSIRVPAEFETPGPFDIDRFPHVRGVLEAIDNSDVREIYLRWATRNAKTFTSLSCLIYLVATTGRSGMLASSTEDRVDDVITTEVYPLVEDCPETRAMLLPKHQRNRDLGVVLGKARIRRAFANSRSALAGFPAAYGLANEVALWPMNAVNRFRQRSRLFPFDRKLIFEGKPEDEGNCTITSLVDAVATQRRYRLVPCPHCGEFQKLVWGDQKADTPGIKWEGKSKGKRDPVKAQETAHYRCVNGCRITDADRPGMMRAGQWVPEGQRLAADGTLIGEPDVRSVENIAFDELSSLYSLAIGGWGDLVREWLTCAGDPEAIREFETGTLARCWTPRQADIAPNIVAQRLKSDEPTGRVPEWAVFLTRAFDVQTQPTGLEFPWGVCAWGKHGRGALVDYGVAYGPEQVAYLCQTQEFHHADGGPPLRPCWTAIDASDGNVTEEIYSLARSIFHALPVKGMAHAMQEAYRLTPLAKGRRDARHGYRKRIISNGETMLLGVNSDRSQSWIQKQLEGVVNRDQSAWFSISHEAHLDDGLIAELLNEIGEDVLGRDNFKKRRWVRRDPNRPNDMRDVIRYCWTLAMFVTDQGKNWSALPEFRSVRPAASQAPSRKRDAKQPAVLTGGGRKWR